MAWIQGGHPERFAAAVMLVVCLIVTLNFILRWDVGGHYLLGRIADYVRLLIFVWLCFRSDRWWPFLMTAAIGLIVVVDIVALLDPHISQRGAASARIGLEYLADLTLLLGVYERWLAGEEPASRAAWARADVATAARRNRKVAGHRSKMGHAPPRLTSPPSRPTSDA